MQIFLRVSAVALALAVASSPGAAQAPQPPADPAGSTWTIDVSHSELTFSIRHLVSRVRGHFGRWNGAITGSLDDWESASVSVSIDASTVNTNNERRDADLRGAEFFDAARYPAITFRSTRIERSGDRVRVTGDLTIRDVTRPLVLEGTSTGTTTDQRGRMRAGFEASGTINRKDYGIMWNRALEAGGVVLGDDVRIELAIAAVRSD